MIVFRIKEIRKKKNITAYKLSKLINVSRAYMSELENNKRLNPSMKVLFDIATVLEVNVKDLFYTTFDIENLRKQLHERIERYGLNSKEALEISQVIDLLINIKMNEELDS